MSMLLGRIEGGDNFTDAECTWLRTGSAPGIYTSTTTTTTKTTNTNQRVYNGYGYFGSSDYHSYGSTKGSMGSYTYDDGTATERTITEAALSWTTFNQTGFVVFSLDTTSIANTDDTFIRLEINGETYTRSDATYEASKNGGTHWYWWTAESYINRPYAPTGGLTYSFKVIV